MVFPAAAAACVTYTSLEVQHVHCRTLFADVNAQHAVGAPRSCNTDATMGRSGAPPQDAQAQHVGVGVGLTEWLYLTLTAVFFCACAYVQAPHFVVELCTAHPSFAHGIRRCNNH
jgi:hypothetical protein